MKTLRVLAVCIAVSAFAAPASAQVVNLSKMSCKEFRAVGK